MLGNFNGLLGKSLFLLLLFATLILIPYERGIACWGSPAAPDDSELQWAETQEPPPIVQAIIETITHFLKNKNPKELTQQQYADLAEQVRQALAGAPTLEDIEREDEVDVEKPPQQTQRLSAHDLESLKRALKQNPSLSFLEVTLNSDGAITFSRHVSQIRTFCKGTARIGCVIITVIGLGVGIYFWSTRNSGDSSSSFSSYGPYG